MPVRLIVCGALVCALLAVPARTSAQSRLPYDQEVTATIAASDMQLEDGSFYQEWSFTATAGARLVITMRSARFDSALLLGRYTADGDWQTLVFDDDSGGGLDAEIVFVVPADGEYYVRANTLNSNQTGNYTLRLTADAAGNPRPPETDRRAAAPSLRAVIPSELTKTSAAAAPRPIALREEVTSSLDPDDPVLSDGSYFEYWSFQAMRGQRFQIVMRSEEVDAFLSIGRFEDGVFRSLLSNDDGAGDTDSLLVFTAPADGEYVIRANSVTREVGEYTLLVQQIL